MEHFDLIIIGSGSGNSLVTSDFADKRVAVVEEGTFGGTCLNVGCIPTKMFVYAAEVASTVREAGKYGIDASLEGVRWPDIRERVFGRIDPISEGGRDFRVTGENTTAFLGHAQFSGPRELTVTITSGAGQHEVGSRHVLTADQIVIATGSRATVPDPVRDSGVAVETSDTIMRMAELPESLAIVGGGFIAAEFAHIFSSLGVDVTVITRGPAMVRHLDEEIVTQFNAVAGQHWTVHPEAEVTEVTGTDDGVLLELSDDTHVRAQRLLVATGRIPNSDQLSLESTAVTLHPDGRIRVDQFGRTDQPGVWALGDVSAPYQLKHLANHEARVIAHNLAHPEDLHALQHNLVPAAIFTHPQIASVGMTEGEARQAGYDVATKVQSYGDTAYGWAMEDTTSVAKVVGDARTGLLLGAHLMGPHASTLIQPLIQAMAFGQRAHDVARGQFWIHPALAEVVENALLGLPEPTERIE